MTPSKPPAAPPASLHDNSTVPLGSVSRRRQNPLALAVITDDGQSQLFPLPPHGEVVIGRAADADICINTASVSRSHARIRIRGGPGADGSATGLSVEDLGSANGTTVREQRLTPGQPVAVFPHDIIDVGGIPVVVTGGSRVELAHANTARRPDPSVPPTSIQKTVPPKDASVLILDPEMQRIHHLVERVASTDITVLLLGETGVGKEVLAERLHAGSTRANAPFVRLNCAALAENLLESELFGYVRGAFTGAIRDKTGLLESAGGGTVFLDEIGDMPLSTQTKLLRALEERRVTPVGGVRSVAIDARFVAATNRDLDDMIRSGQFREDLYYRLHGIAVFIPPLRRRRAEILPLAAAFVALAATKVGLAAAPPLSDAAQKALCEHGWPGNVRELKNVIERAVILCDGRIDDEHLSFSLTGTSPVLPTSSMSSPSHLSTPDQAAAAPTSAPTPAATGRDLRSAIEDAEREQLLAALEACAGNQTKAARRLGISRSTLVRRLEHYGIRRPRKDQES